MPHFFHLNSLLKSYRAHSRNQPLRFPGEKRDT